MTAVRRFLANDLFRYNRVNLDPLTETYNFGFYFQYLAQWPHIFYITEDAHGTPSGYIMGKTEGDGLDWHGHVTAVTVAPDCRRIGLAKKLMKILEDASESANTFFVDLFVRCSNQVAIGMYERMGYTIYRRVLQYYSGNEDGYDMRKPLSRDVDKQSLVCTKDVVTADEVWW
eukprot:GCRY01005033.1.p1 GENE.GCRY01005033.1~~GCRY01005033.1.p1  ORF type:complete len:184 (-),score=7.89 GCRY01005033.1:139-657(-)